MISAEHAMKRIEAIVNEPLDEREGHGPNRQAQFARIEEITREWRRDRLTILAQSREAGKA